uniref:Uncharacterized protein n=1 Tax=viral metagenome TaxID=1070528 RepID=A0A6C0EML7_9ZZZZ
MEEKAIERPEKKWRDKEWANWGKNGGNEDWKNTPIPHTKGLFDDGMSHTWRFIHDSMLDEYKKAEEREMRREIGGKNKPLERTKVLHAVLRDYEHELVKLGIISDKNRRADTHHTSPKSFLAPLRGTPTVHIFTNQNEPPQILKLEGGKKRKTKRKKHKRKHKRRKTRRKIKRKRKSRKTRRNTR